MGGNAANATDAARAPLERRAFLIGGAGLALPFLDVGQARAALPGTPADGKLAFKIMRKGAHIGEHRLTFAQDGDALVVHADIRITVRIGPVPVYHFVQRCVEHWKGDRFMAMDCSTSANMSWETVTARRDADGVHVEPIKGGPYVAPADCLPLTHWNRFAYQGPVFDPQSGRPLKFALAPRADDMVQLADGTSVKATRWSVTGDGVMDDYYDVGGVWAGLRVKVQDGSQVDYLRL